MFVFASIKGILRLKSCDFNFFATVRLIFILVVWVATLFNWNSAILQELGGRTLRVNSGPPPARKEGSFRGARGGASIDNANRLYVGNLSWSVDDLALETLFSEQGKVVEARVVYDRESGRSRGFGFVTYSSADEANNAIELLNGVVSNCLSLTV